MKQIGEPANRGDINSLFRMPKSHGQGTSALTA